MEATTKRPDEKPGWFDYPRHVSILYWGLWIVCLALVAADFLYHKHPTFQMDGWFAFYAVFGFAAYSFIVLAGWLLRKIVKRKESYYDR